MAVISMQARGRFWQIGLAAIVLCFAWLLQLTLLSLIPLRAVLCSVPMMVTIVWGAVFGSPLQMPRRDELRNVSLGQIVTMQSLSGSVSGLLVGAFFGALYASILPIYPISFPLVGWVSGYFCLRNFNQGTLLCIPLVLLLSVFAETATALQLMILGRPDVLAHLAQTAVTESIVNAMISPFVFYPLRAWYELTKAPSQEIRA
jgi:rod shape-determining protein MreD